VHFQAYSKMLLQVNLLNMLSLPGFSKIGGSISVMSSIILLPVNIVEAPHTQPVNYACSFPNLHPPF
jgi:hypothetical protein